MNNSLRWSGLVAIALIIATLAFIGGRQFNTRDAKATSQGADLPPETTALSLAALADGVITAEEYRSAFDRFVACSERGGAKTVGSIRIDAFGHLGVGFTSETAEALLAVTEECRRADLDAIELAWALAHRPTDEQSTVAREYAFTCLAAEGVSLPKEKNRESLQRLIVESSQDEGLRVVLGTCLTATAEEFNWPGYGGS